MNKVMVVKNFALRGFNDVRQNPQKYIFKLKKAKLVVIIACDAGERIISIMARWQGLVPCHSSRYKRFIFRWMILVRKDEV